MDNKKITIAEMIVYNIAKCVEDGETVAQGIATPLVSSAFMLAKLTHAPNLVFASAVGNSITFDFAPISLLGIEELNLGKSIVNLSFTQISCELLPFSAGKEFFRPGQVDGRGNFNNIVIGDYYKPKFRLPGCGGIADVTIFSDKIYLYVPRHNKKVFVEKLDFLSGVGFLNGESKEEREKMGITSPGPKLMVTDLGVFTFENGWMEVVSLFPHVSKKEVEEKTSFKVIIKDEIPESPVPDEETLNLLRNKVDPLGIRDLEVLPTLERYNKLKEIIEKETANKKYASVSN